MAKGLWVVASAVLVVSGSLLFAADDAMTAAPTTEPAVPHLDHLDKPWGDLSNVTDDQKAKIEQIQDEVRAQEKAIDVKAKADIEALLTDDQKTELKSLEAKEKAAQKAAKKKKKKEKAPETPAGGDAPSDAPAQ